MMDRKRNRIVTVIISVVIVALCALIIVASLAIKSRIENEIADSIDDGEGGGNTATQPEEPNLPDHNEIIEAKFIDLQPTVDAWVKTLSSNEQAGVMIYDINNSRTAASYNANEVFNVASIYKLLFAYDGYKQLAIGAETGDEIYTTTEDKGTLTVSQCLDLIIRESYNGCADRMISDPYRASRASDLVREVGMSNTSANGLESTAADLTKLLRTYWRHTDLTPELWAKLTDSMLVQPPTPTTDGDIYDWRQGLPAGFADNVDVYNKVGWKWNPESKRWDVYADAAIVNFTEFDHYYTIVVLTSNLSNYNKITRLGQMIEDAVIAASEGVIK